MNIDNEFNVKELPRELLDEMESCMCACGSKVGSGGGTR